MQYVIGIDGGGSTIRLVVVNAVREIVAEHIGPTVNPSVVGREESAQRIQSALFSLLEQAALDPQQIGAVGAGVAGAAPTHSGVWLEGVISEALPLAKVAVSADYEIALVGAVGKRHGVLVLSGTGSLAYGVNAAGESALVGGWGYLIGDEGSGYWFGASALRAVVQAADGRGPETLLTSLILRALALQKPLEIIPWLYHAEVSRTREVAGLVPLILEAADAGDAVALGIIEQGAAALVHAAQTVTQRLGIHAPEYAFAGSLLTTDNAVSRQLCRLLNLTDRPQPQYAPVMGAAILAWEAGSR